MKKVVFIAYSLNNPKLADGIQTRRFLSKLSEYYDIKIYARDFNYPINKDIKNVNYISSPKLIYLEIIIYKLLKMLYPIFGIDKLIWSIKAYKAIKKNKDVDFIISTHEPYTLYFLINRLKKKLKCRSITLLFDPLVDNNMYPTGKISFKIRQYFEFKILKQSDILFLYTKLLYNIFVRRYPTMEYKIKLLNFCSENKKLFSNNRHKKITIIHAGNLAGRRDLKFIISAIKILNQRYRNNLSNIFQFISYGGYRVKDVKMIKENNVEDLVFLKGFIEKDKLYEEEMKADILLVIDSLVNVNVFFPSKLTEYFMFSKMIFAITPKISATREWLEGSGHLCFSDDETHALVDSLEKVIQDRHYYDDKFDDTLYKYFTPKYVTEKFFEIVSSMEF